MRKHQMMSIMFKLDLMGTLFLYTYSISNDTILKSVNIIRRRVKLLECGIDPILGKPVGRSNSNVTFEGYR